MGSMSKEYFREYRKRKAQAVQGASASVQAVQAGSEQAEQASPAALSTTSPARASSAVSRRPCNFPEPRQPGTPHIPLCPPAPRDAYERAKLLLSEGMGMAEVRRVTGATWVALDEAAHAYDDYDAWMRAKDMHKAAMAARIAGAAAAAGIEGVKRKVVRKTVNGVVAEETVTEEHGTDAALLRVAGEYTDPERFGKLARAGEGAAGASVNLQVVGTVILARPEPLNED